MKQKRRVSMIGALVLIISAVVLITGCPQANGNNGKKDNATTKNDGNSDSSLEVQSTAEADPALKGANWSGEGKAIYFAEDGNIASINSEQMLYTVQREKISFDLSSFIAIAENMTEEKLIQKIKIEIKNSIAELEKKIKEAEKEGDEPTKTQLEAKLAEMKELLQMLENPNEQMKEEIKQSLKDMHEYASKIKPYAKFDGIFNSEKTRLTIEKFPNYDRRTKEVTIKKIVFEKE